MIWNHIEKNNILHQINITFNNDELFCEMILPISKSFIFYYYIPLIVVDIR